MPRPRRRRRCSEALHASGRIARRNLFAKFLCGLAKTDSGAATNSAAYEASASTASSAIQAPWS